MVLLSRKTNGENIKPANVKKSEVISGQLDKQLQNKRARKLKRKAQRGIVFIKHLPHGFYEEQLQKFFQQFGKITRVRVARSSRTGGSKGFGFIEFEIPEVAKIAAETMDNHLMFQRILRTAYIPPEEQRFDYFKTSVRKVTHRVGKSIYVSTQTAGVQRQIKTHNNWNEEACQKRVGRTLTKLRKLKKKYHDLGIDFDKYVIKPNICTPKEKHEVEEVNKVDKPVAPAGKAVPNKKESQKGQKRSATKVPIQNEPKPKKKNLQLKDLLENTLNEDSSDEDFIPEQKVVPARDQKKVKSKSQPIGLQDLLGNTINDDSSDEDFIPDSDELDTSQMEVIDKDRSIQLADLLGNTLNNDSSDEDYVPSEQDEKGVSKQKATSAKKSLELVDLLGNTINEDSSDEDFIPDSEDEVEAKPKKKSVELADLLGNTINDDSSDDDFIPSAEEAESPIDIGVKITRKSAKKEAPAPVKSKQKSITLADLLGNTINDDSSDEDFTPDQEEKQDRKRLSPIKSPAKGKAVLKNTISSTVSKSDNNNLKNARSKKKAIVQNLIQNAINEEPSDDELTSNQGDDLLDLLGNTINDDSSDEEFIPNPEDDDDEDDVDKSLGPEDLLGNTLNDDSSDEDFIPMGEHGVLESDTSDEETYGMTGNTNTQQSSKTSKQGRLNKTIQKNKSVIKARKEFNTLKGKPDKSNVGGTKVKSAKVSPKKVKSPKSMTRKPQILVPPKKVFKKK